MHMRCPQCAQKLLVRREVRTELLLCPYCQRTFRLTPATATSQLLVAVDVSTSALPHLAEMQREIVALQAQSQEDGSNMRIFTFHRHWTPFPCEQLCRPHWSGAVVLPTLRDLRGRVAPGSAVLDSLYLLLIEAESTPQTRHRLVVLTDGKENHSRRHPEEIRRRLERAATGTRIHMLGFLGGRHDTALLQLMRKLSTPRIMWSFHAARQPDSSRREILLFPKSTPTSDSKGHASCYV